MTVDEAFALAARLDLGECDSREDLFVKLHERHMGVIADLVALSERPPKGVSDARLFELRAARLAELALVEEALTGLGELGGGEARARIQVAAEGAESGEGNHLASTAPGVSSGSPSSGEGGRG